MQNRIIIDKLKFLGNRTLNRIKRWLHPRILSKNRWITPLSEQIEHLKTLDPDYFAWLMSHKLVDAFPRLIMAEYPQSKNVLFSVIIPVYNTPPSLLEKAVKSVVKQIYSEWEIVICDDASDSIETLKYLEYLSETYPTCVKITINSHNMGVSESTNACVANSQGNFIVFLDHDDELYPDALLKTKEAIDRNPDSGVFYSDEDYISPDGYRHSYNFKPDFSPSLLETHNYILHLVCIKKELFIQVGMLRKKFDGSQDYDLLLRLMDMGEKFIHIQDILYSWRENETSMIGGMLKPEIFERGKKALEEHYTRSGDRIEYIKDNIENIKGVYRTRFAMPKNISILAVQIGKGGFRFNLYDTLPSIEMRLMIWEPSDPFPMEIADTDADIVIFLDKSLVPHSWQEFLNETVPLALREQIGAVGAFIYSGDDKIIAAGRSLMPWGAMRNDFWGHDSAEKNSHAKRTRDVIAVSGAAMVISSKVLRDVLMEGDIDKSMWDVEICFRLNRSIYKNNGTGYKENGSDLYSDSIEVEQSKLNYRVVFNPNAFLLYKGTIDQYHGTSMFYVKHLVDKYNIDSDSYLNLNLIDIKNRKGSDKRTALPSYFERIKEEISEEEAEKIEMEEKKSNDFYHKWITLHSPDLKKSSERIAKLEYKPFFSVILPTYNSELLFFKELINSLKAQTYSKFEICISDDGSTESGFLEFLGKIESESKNIRVIYSDKNSGIAGNTNRAISIAKGDWFILCDHDDLVEPFALEVIAQYINDNPTVDVLYSDEDMVDQKGWRHSPRLQPDWNPDMLLSHMYCPHIVSFKRQLLNIICNNKLLDNNINQTIIHQTEQVTPLNPEMDGAQDYDFFLRLTEKAQKIGHIPMILYSWRSVKGSVALDACAKIYAYDAGKRALEAAIKRRGEEAVVLKASGTKLGVYRVKRKVSLPCSCSHIIEAGSPFIDSMVNNIRNISPVPVDIVLVCRYCDEPSLSELSNISDIKIIMVKNSTVKSEIYNAGADAAKGEHLIFSSRSIDLLDSDYPFGLLEHTKRNEVGAAGIKIIYPNGFFYHTGMLLGVNGVAGYAHRNIEQCPGYWHFASCIRNYSVVSWDFMGIAKNKFYEVEGFDVLLSQFGDVDFCLKLIAKGYKNIYTPYVSAVINRSVHFLEELRNIKEEEIILERYGNVISNDPMHHPLMSKTLEDFSIGL